MYFSSYNYTIVIHVFPVLAACFRVPLVPLLPANVLVICHIIRRTALSNGASVTILRHYHCSSGRHTVDIHNKCLTEGLGLDLVRLCSKVHDVPRKSHT